ncbi:MAG: hypothetical protein LDL24_10645 [Treponema sp.]|nr:hypothetical protein [Treponema sp.]
MFDIQTAVDMYLKQPEDWARENRQKTPASDQHHDSLILRMVLYLFNH